ncbi:MAG: glycosyltransferase family 2 protein [Victivallales bacterium]|nr:glycosyltransferase family 2 protein [Victivallales bacterium]
MDISVIIVNYATPRLTRECVESIRKQTAPEIKYEIIIVDNASPDGSGPLLQAELTAPDCTVILNPRNDGFGGANNIGIARATGEYLFLLNSDTILLNDALGIFLRRAREYPGRLGCAGALMLSRDLTPQISSRPLPSGWRIIWGTLSGYFSRYVLRRSYSHTTQRFPEGCDTMKVGYVWGADMFVPASVLREVGCFDTDYFMYFEETDLQCRMRNAGYDRVLFREPEIIHLGGGSSHSMRRFKAYYRSMWLYIRKHRLFTPF